MPGGVTTDVKTYQMFINGEWVASKSGKTFPVYDPSTEEVIAQVPEASAEDVNSAVAAAKAAFELGPWATTTAQERGRVLFRLADKVRQNLPALAELECRNTGKPIVEAEYDLNDVATCFEYYGGLATKVVGFVNPVPDNAMSLTLKEPVGVAGQIIPWNYPLLMAAWKLAPATGRLSRCTPRGMPRRMCIPNFMPSLWTQSASGLNPAPCAAEGKRAGSGVRRPLASQVN